ncbi:hypothetical protein CLF_105581 [Clonorchis sinensis]|uniref:Peptidase A2 domain-containing protein n=1 Tax=Clonorchis sinensis TaxID=79923 RepID=G7YDR2_CLOSI|nr:hypothetical protein CLF_105581 [Clonorchis sinensis]
MPTPGEFEARYCHDTRKWSRQCCSCDLEPYCPSGGTRSHLRHAGNVVDRISSTFVPEDTGAADIPVLDQRKIGVTESKGKHPRCTFHSKVPKARVVLAAHQSPHANRRKYVSVRIKGTPVRLQLDTASDITIISKRTWKLLGSPALTRTKQVARSASDSLLKLSGEFKYSMTVDGITVIGICHVSDRPVLDLLGLNWIDKLNLSDRLLNNICYNTQATKPGIFKKLFWKKHSEDCSLCIKSLSYDPQSNRQAERFVATFNQALFKTRG